MRMKKSARAPTEHNPACHIAGSPDSATGICAMSGYCWHAHASQLIRGEARETGTAVPTAPVISRWSKQAGEPDRVMGQYGSDHIGNGGPCRVVDDRKLPKQVTKN